jgi:hypothetical protein
VTGLSNGCGRMETQCQLARNKYPSLLARLRPVAKSPLRKVCQPSWPPAFLGRKAIPDSTVNPNRKCRTIQGSAAPNETPANHEHVPYRMVRHQAASDWG